MAARRYGNGRSTDANASARVDAGPSDFRDARVNFDQPHAPVIPNLIRDSEPRAMTFVVLDLSMRWDDERWVQRRSKTTLG